MEQICIFSFLGINSYLDVKKGQISLCLTAAYFLLGVLYVLLNGKQWELFLMGVIPGILLLCIGKASRGALGLGDGMIVLVCGIYLGIWRVIEWVTIGLFMAAIWAGVLMIVRKKNRRASFPFVPFLLAAYSMLCMIQVMEG